MTPFKTFLNFPHFGPNPELNTLKSETVPDMTMTLAELLQRHTRGQEIPTFEGTYNDEYIPDIERLDLTEIQAIAENHKNYVDEAIDNAAKESTETKKQLTEKKQKEDEEAAKRAAEFLKKSTKQDNNSPEK
jgi:hypothetical protein